MNQLSVFTRSTMLDPRICNIGHDANALDRDGSPRDALVDRFRTLTSAGRLTVVVAGGVRDEIAMRFSTLIRQPTCRMRSCRASSTYGQV
jgi:hypothetical protein